MHILLVADGRSPITRRWVQSLVTLENQVTLVSSFPCNPLPGVTDMFILPVAFAGLGGNQVGGSGAPIPRPDRLRQAVSRSRNLFLSTRYLIGPATLPFYKRSFINIVEKSKPDLVHALRIPFEGMLARYTPPGVPLVVSIWGNDLTLHGLGSPRMRTLTESVLQKAVGLMADAHRDIRLGQHWGFGSQKPSLVVPGAGGVDLMEINRANLPLGESLADRLPAGMPLVVNPRGFRPGSVRNDVFFQAIPLVLQRWTSPVHFICTAMDGQPEAIRWVQRLNLGQHVRLLPYLTQPQLWDLFLRVDISVSISTHDGTPNTLLEAMACGCLPVAGDIESLREWITPGVNGLLVEPGKPQALAEALLLGLEHPELRKRAAEVNRNIIRQRADASMIRTQVGAFYQKIVNNSINGENGETGSMVP